MTVPDYLVIGTITKDLLEDGFTIGGTATYAAATASRLGQRAAIVTSAAAELDLPDDLSDVQIACAPSPASGRAGMYQRAVLIGKIFASSRSIASLNSRSGV